MSRVTPCHYSYSSLGKLLVNGFGANLGGDEDVGTLINICNDIDFGKIVTHG